MGVLLYVVVLWIVPIFLSHAMGKPKRRGGVMYGLLLGWLGVIILALLPPLAELTPEQCLRALDKKAGGYSKKVAAQKRAELQVQLDAHLAATNIHRDCPYCKEPMRRDASVCPHCRHDSEAWTQNDGYWWLRIDGVWNRYLESTGAWEPERPSTA